MSFQYVKNYDTPFWLKTFLFILKIDKWHEFGWLCSKDPLKEIQEREGLFFQVFHATYSNSSDMEVKNFILFLLN